ncbi:hypothetical protein SAMN04487792_1076 [Lactobacillus bombicola]|uniref:Uncharacterized protein n=1 Tax=Lactobacillus bombicola TaxID=1505723 RepID=A0A1I1SR17_9LACO|nr:hypothetical protein [Lactobacillus bombicola]SFD48915.1 hypothetical protein SAMN04487792_1076 [Lactobacillus bombicola]
MINEQDYIKQGLKDDGNLKLILRGSVEHSSSDAEGKVGVVSVVYATHNCQKARQKFAELTAAAKDDYYMVYSCPLDTDLPTLEHYPSIQIGKDDLL